MRIDLIVSRHPAAVEFIAATIGGSSVGITEERLIPTDGGYLIETPDPDNGYSRGETVVIADCGGWGVGDRRFKSVCRCGRECSGGTHSTIKEIKVVPRLHVVIGDAVIPVFAQATADDVRGNVVAGNLPLHLACLARSVYTVEFEGRPPRGQEYTLEDMRVAGARLVSYTVSRSEDLDTPYEVGGYLGTLGDMVDSVRGIKPVSFSSPRW